MINHGGEPFEVRRGDRVAQLVLAPVTQASWLEVGELDVPDVLERLPGRFRGVRQPAVAEVADVEPGHVVAGGLQLLGEDRPDIAQISGDEQFHIREAGRRGGGSARRMPLIGQPWAMVSRR